MTTITELWTNREDYRDTRVSRGHPTWKTARF